MRLSRRTTAALGILTGFTVAAPALAIPVVHRNGDGAWFAWTPETNDLCEAPPGAWLDFSLPADQTGARTDRSLKRYYACSGGFGCVPDQLFIQECVNRLCGQAQIAQGAQLWNVGDGCSSRYDITHVAEIDYAAQIGPSEIWSDGETWSFSSFDTEISVHTPFIAVRAAAPGGGFNYGWIMYQSRRYPQPGDPFAVQFPTAWAFETEPDTPIATPPCVADIDFNGQVDFFDYLQFVEDFDAGHWVANLDRNQEVDFFDYLDFVEAYAACDR